MLSHQTQAVVEKTIVTLCEMAQKKLNSNSMSNEIFSEVKLLVEAAAKLVDSVRN
ncbi:hypothetical protein [Paenibacillus polymyxa]|uniref:hypothetical protein n=1 Tax=Paenibacillus polymyxa TaxID=1406 RepID=UPI002ED19890|nr:hypothetical protein [Paenibacillus polymyxa]